MTRPGVTKIDRPADVSRMGVESRDWYRGEPARRRGDRRAAIAAVAALIAALVVGPTVADRLGARLPWGIGAGFRATPRGAVESVRPLPGATGITVARQSLYPHDDPWRGWLADETACPGGESTTASARAQLQTMTCLMNVARSRQGLAPLAVTAQLSSAAGLKANDIVRCATFAHDACGKDPVAVAHAVGYAGSFGENLYVAEGPLGAPRVAMDGWLNSPGHREDLFEPRWRVAGIALLEHATFGPFHDAELWVMEFGDR